MFKHPLEPVEKCLKLILLDVCGDICYHLITDNELHVKNIFRVREIDDVTRLEVTMKTNFKP